MSGDECECVFVSICRVVFQPLSFNYINLLYLKVLYCVCICRALVVYRDRDGKKKKEKFKKSVGLISIGFLYLNLLLVTFLEIYSIF